MNEYDNIYLREAYEHGYYDAMVEQTKGEDYPPVYAVAQLEQPAPLFKTMMTPTILEKQKFFCVISGLEQQYKEYYMSIQAANRRSNKFSNYLIRIWDALRNRVIISLEPEPREIWIAKVAREFGEVFRSCNFVADLQINVTDGLQGEPKKLTFKALTWKAPIKPMKGYLRCKT